MSNNHFRMFDSHLHIINPKFPLVPNNNYIPSAFTCENYLNQIKPHRHKRLSSNKVDNITFDFIGGVIVSGSFQAFDQDYLISALHLLGPSFVGVTQLPISVSDSQLQELNDAGIRGIRFNLQRGGSEHIKYLDKLARRVYDTVGWHSELYIDSKELDSLFPILSALPALSIDHLGLSISGKKTLLRLVEKGVRVKATGFGRVNFDVKIMVRDIHKINPNALMFGTDLPCTRSQRPYMDDDFLLIIDTLGEYDAKKVLSENAISFYRQQPQCSEK